MAKIKTVEQIMKLADKGKSVVVKYSDGLKATSAAFVQNYNGRYLYNLIKSGMIYEYKKENKHNVRSPRKVGRS
jgi:hypothetical protein